MRFRLLRGTMQDKDGIHKAADRKTSVVNSEMDLVKRFGQEKFERLPDKGGFAGTDETPETSNSADDLGLNEMTIAELRKFAEEENIDLGTATRKDEIINTIREGVAG